MTRSASSVAFPSPPHSSSDSSTSTTVSSQTVPQFFSHSTSFSPLQRKALATSFETTKPRLPSLPSKMLSLMPLSSPTPSHTTSYHPIANRIIERFHRQLKASLKAHTPTVHWTKSLPLVLLGIRTALKDDLRCSAAELVYGTTLRLPAEFLQQSTTDTTADPASLVTRLKHTMREFRASPVRTQPQRNVHVTRDLSSCTHVFIRNNTVCKPLQ